MIRPSPKSKNLPNRSVSLHLAALIAGLLVLAGCATTPPPSQAMQAAQLAITSAERDRVAEYAAPELGQARTKLAAAREAVNQKQMVQAERLALQARASAELASAKSDAAKAALVNDEMNKSIEVLREEMQRSTGARP